MVPVLSAFLSIIATVTGWAEPYGVNLLAGVRNGNAEQGQAFPSGPPGIPVPSWTTNGVFTVVPYGSTGQPAGFPAAAGSGPTDRGNQFFSGGQGPVGVATQEIDLSANAADISGGKVIADLSAWLGGSGGVQDYATVAISFYNGKNASRLRLAPNNDAITISRTSPRIPLQRIATPTTPVVRALTRSFPLSAIATREKCGRAALQT
jgi:hypothetical protein